MDGIFRRINSVTNAAGGLLNATFGNFSELSIQIALFVAPVLVLLSTFVGPGQMNLTFARPLIVFLFLSVILAAMVAGDGRSNWYKGVQMIIVYVIMGLALFFIPAA